MQIPFFFFLSPRATSINHKTTKLHHRTSYQRTDSTKLLLERFTSSQNDLVQRQQGHTRRQFYLEFHHR